MRVLRCLLIFGAETQVLGWLLGFGAEMRVLGLVLGDEMWVLGCLLAFGDETQVLGWVLVFGAVMRLLGLVLGTETWLLGWLMISGAETWLSGWLSVPGADIGALERPGAERRRGLASPGWREQLGKALKVKTSSLCLTCEGGGGGAAGKGVRGGLGGGGERVASGVSSPHKGCCSEAGGRQSQPRVCRVPRGHGSAPGCGESGVPLLPPPGHPAAMERGRLSPDAGVTPHKAPR